MNHLAALNQTDFANIENNGLSRTFHLRFANIGDIISKLLPYFFGFAGFALIVYIVLAGYALMTSKGDERAVAAAKAKLTYGVAGFLVVFVSYWVVALVGKILGITIIQTIFQ